MLQTGQACSQISRHLPRALFGHLAHHYNRQNNCCAVMNKPL